jgi:hypothetical protein
VEINRVEGSEREGREGQGEEPWIMMEKCEEWRGDVAMELLVTYVRRAATPRRGNQALRELRNDLLSGSRCCELRGQLSVSGWHGAPLVTS